jgi:hypothetical protein
MLVYMMTKVICMFDFYQSLYFYSQHGPTSKPRRNFFWGTPAGAAELVILSLLII